MKIAHIDAHAARLGLSRMEYLRRRPHRRAARPAAPVTADDRRSPFGSEISTIPTS
jgi:hypothetical protein